MEKGKIIFLNGVTSSGKTSIIKDIFSRTGVLFYALSYDLFEETIPPWAADTASHYAEAIIAMYYAARGFSDQGRNVLIDGLIMNIEGLEAHYNKLKEIFSGYPLDIIHIYCPLDLCRKRNIARKDRRENQSEMQMEVAEKNVDYRFVINTGEHTVSECADMILEKYLLSDSRL